MSRAYHIFLGRLSSRASENRNAAVIECSGIFPAVETRTEPDSTASTALELLSGERYTATGSSSGLQHPISYADVPKPSSKFLQRWEILNPKIVDTKVKKKRKLRTFKLMEQLPVELRRAILNFIDIQTLKSLRLTSKSWAGLGEEYLISNFYNALPHRPDTDRLKALSDHSKFSNRIQHIKFNHGEVNEYHARHNTYFMLYTREPEARVDEMNFCWNSYALIREKKDQYLPGSCDRTVLTDVFGRLPNLRAIEVTLMENPFQENHPELLRNLWSMPSTRHLPRVATTERFTDILAAVATNSSTVSIKTLSHDRLPFEFFAQKESRLSLFTPLLESLTSLTLSIDYSDMPNNLHARQAFERLARFLQTASSLERLDLAFQGRRKIDIAPLLSSMVGDTHTFVGLKQIKLGGIIASEIELGDFLVRQKNSLRHVHIGGHGVRGRHQPPNGGVHLSTGSFRGLFARMGREMKLDSLKVQGDLIGMESNEKWIMDYVEDERNLGEYVLD